MLPQSPFPHPTPAGVGDFSTPEAYPPGRSPAWWKGAATRLRSQLHGAARALAAALAPFSTIAVQRAFRPLYFTDQTV